MTIDDSQNVQNRLALVAPLLRKTYAPGTFADFAAVNEFVAIMTLPNHPRRNELSLNYNTDAVAAVVFYGSCLNPGTRKADSTPDFYVVVDSYRRFYGGEEGGRRGCKRQAVLNAWLPPSIFSFVDSKFCVISLEDLERETSARAGDVYNMGRFSKRLAIAYVKDDGVLDRLIMCCAAAMDQVLWRSLPLLPERFHRQEAILKALKLSYLGDLRVEAHDKILKIYESQKEFYDVIFGTLLGEIAKQVSWCQQQGNDYFLNHPSSATVRATNSFIRRSRIRSLLRWPKYAITNKNWINYMLAKINRAQGVKIVLTPFERRFILIYVWKYIWQLRKQRLLK